MSAARSAVPVGNASAPSVAYDHADGRRRSRVALRGSATSASATTGARCGEGVRGRTKDGEGPDAGALRAWAHVADVRLERLQEGRTSDVVSSRPSSSAPTIAASELSAADTCTALSRPQWWVTSSESSAGLPAFEGGGKHALGLARAPEAHARRAPARLPVGTSARPVRASANQPPPRGLRALPFSADRARSTMP